MAAKDNLWHLAGATKYQEDCDRPTFGGSPKILSRHTFGWDRQHSTFVLEADRFIGGTTRELLKVPPGVAEKFLLRCIELDFHAQFLVSRPLAAEVDETILAGISSILVSRSQSPADKTRSGLSISLVAKPEQRIFLFHELRESFGSTVSKLNKAVVPTQLRAFA